MKLRKCISWLLIAMMLFSLTACGATDQVKLAGEWKGTVDISAHLAQVPGLKEEPKDITFDLIFVFGSDGTFEAIIDRYSVKVMVDKLLDLVADAMSDSAKENGLSDRELRELLQTHVDMDAIVDSVEKSLQNGFYLYRDGVIYLSAEDDLQEDPQAHAQERLVVTLAGDTLVVEQIVSISYQHEQMLGGVLPLTLYKQ